MLYLATYMLLLLLLLRSVISIVKTAFQRVNKNEPVFIDVDTC